MLCERTYSETVTCPWSFGETFHIVAIVERLVGIPCFRLLFGLEKVPGCHILAMANVDRQFINLPRLAVELQDVTDDKISRRPSTLWKEVVFCMS